MGFFSTCHGKPEVVDHARFTLELASPNQFRVRIFHIVAKLVVALLMLALGSVIVRAIRGGPLTNKSITISVAASLITVIGVHLAFSNPHRIGASDWGIIDAIIGALCGPVFLRTACHSPEQRRPSRTWAMSALAFVSGPIIGLVGALLSVFLTDVHPLDRGSVFIVDVTIGTISGFLGAGVIAAICSLSRSSQDSELSEKK